MKETVHFHYVQQLQCILAKNSSELLLIQAPSYLLSVSIGLNKILKKRASLNNTITYIDQLVLCATPLHSNIHRFTSTGTRSHWSLQVETTPALTPSKDIAKGSVNQQASQPVSVVCVDPSAVCPHPPVPPP